MDSMRPNVDQHRRKIRESIAASASLSAAYLTMNPLATVVAGYGLLANSTAVVIGAMVIAMLLGPIMGIALALVDGNNRLLKAALIAEVVGALLVLAVGYVIGRVHLDIPLSQEILSRTKPNILDLMIALGGGAAGAYATVSPKMSVGLVGVAIATALVPPLASCSICLAHGEPALAWGAFVLFLTNLVAIQFASSVVMWLHGYHQVTELASDKRSLIRRNVPSIVLMIALGVSLTVNLRSVLAAQAFESSVRESLDKSLRSFPGARLVDVWFDERELGTEIMAVVRTPNSFPPDRVAAIESKLPKSDGKERTLRLHIRAVLTKESTTDGYVYERSTEAIESPNR